MVDMNQFFPSTRTGTPSAPMEISPELQARIDKQREDRANSWSNRFAIGIDNTQASMFKGLDLIADVAADFNPEGAQSLKKYAQRGIIKNQREAASKPQPTRTASLTEASKEIGQDVAEGEFFDAAARSLLLLKDMSAEALPSMLPTLGAFAGTAVAAPLIGATPIVGGALALSTRLVAPLVPGFLMGGGETYEEAKKLGATEKDAKRLAVAGGAGISLLEKMGAAHALKNLIKTSGKEFTEKTLGNYVGKDTAKKAIQQADDILNDPKLFVKKHMLIDAGKSAVKAGSVEGDTEAAQEAIQIGSAGVAADKGINPYDNADYVNRLIDAAALGFVGGKIAGTGAGVLSNLNHRDVVNRTKDRKEELDKLEQHLKEEGEMTDSELQNVLTVKRDQYKPSFIDNIFRQSLTPLAALEGKNRAGYEVVNALKNYYDNVSADVGSYARSLDTAISKVRRDIKAPLIQKSVSKKKNKELFDMLMYGTESKDIKVRESAKQIREEILGQAQQTEIKLDKKSFLDSIIKQKSTLAQLEKAKATGKINKAKVQNIENTFNFLKKDYATKLNNELKRKDITPAQATKQVQQTLQQDKQFQSLQDNILVPFEGTGLFGKLNESDIDVHFKSDYFPRVYNIGLRDVVLGSFGMGKLKKARKILMEEEIIDPTSQKKRKRTEEEANEILDNIRANDGMYVPDTEITELEAQLDAPDNTIITKETQSNLEKQRVISEGTFKKLEQAGLVETDVKKVLDKYILQAVQRDNVRKIKRIIDPNIRRLTEAKLLDKGELDRIKEVYQAIQNRYKPIQEERLKKASRLYLTYQYILTLPLAALTALSEPIIILTRVNPKHALPATMQAVTNTFRQGIRTVLPKFKKSEQEQAFMDILQGFDGTLAERLGDIAGIDVTRKVTDRFFKFTMLTQITQFSRDIAFQAMQSQIKSDISILANSKLLDGKSLERMLAQENLSIGEVKARIENARKRLSELGLTERNLKLVKGNFNESNILKWAEGSLEGAAPEIIRRALSKGVDDIIMAPNVVNRPLWMSNPKLALFAQLKGFMFAFGSKVGGRFIREIIKPLFAGRVPVDESVRYATAIMLIMAASMAIREMKDEIRYGDEPSPWKDADFAERLKQALITTNIAGSGTMLYDAFNAQRYGLAPAEALAGPGPQHISRLITAIGSSLSGNPRPLSTHVARSVPFVSSVFPRKTSDISDTVEDFLSKYIS